MKLKYVHTHSLYFFSFTDAVDSIQSSIDGAARMMKKKTCRTKTSSLNTRKRITTQKTQTNSISQPSITALRRTKPIVKVKRDITPVKLPTIKHKTSSTSKFFHEKYKRHDFVFVLDVKSFPSPYIQDPS
jgi:hypothetical protein